MSNADKLVKEGVFSYRAVEGFEGFGVDFYIYLTEFFRFVRVYGYCKYGLVLADGDFDVEAFWIVRIYDDFIYYVVVFEGSSRRLC